MRRAFPLLIVACALSACRSSDAPPPIPALGPAPAIDVTTVDGRAFHLSDLRGRVVLLTFGYTSCPDVCPLTLSRAKSALRKLGSRAKDVRLVFVSVDPARDTPARLKDYVGAFDSRFDALPLDPATLADVTARYHVVVNKQTPDPRRYVDRPQADLADYTLDHTGGFIVVDRGGRLRLRLAHDLRVDALADALSPLLDEEP